MKKENNEISDYDDVINMEDNMIIDEEEYFDELSEEKEPSEKETLENFLNCEVDYMIDEKNANLINHTGLKVPPSYEIIENILVDQLILILEENIKNGKSCADLFEIMKTIIEIKENSPFSMNSDNNSFCIIRKTKKILLEKTLTALFKAIIQNLVKSFLTNIKNEEKRGMFSYLSSSEKKQNNEYICDLNDLNSTKREKVTDIVKKEIENLKDFIYVRSTNCFEDEFKKNELKKLIDGFISYDGIPEVLLFKKMVWFYYKELGIYEEKNEKIIKCLKKADISCDNCDENILINESNTFIKRNI